MRVFFKLLRFALRSVRKTILFGIALFFVLYILVGDKVFGIIDELYTNGYKAMYNEATTVLGDASVKEKIQDGLSEIKEHFDSSEAVETDEFQTATLKRVVDGDTIVVDIEGTEYRVRLIGVDTPESVHPDSMRNTEEGIKASDYSKQLLKDCTKVYLQKDTSDTDKYGRLLRYVWLEIPKDKNNVNEVMTKMMNGILVMDGVATPKTYKPDVAYKETFEFIAKSRKETTK